MDRELTERTAAILDTVSTWDGVCRVVRRGGTTTLRLDGRALGRTENGCVEVQLPGKLSRVVVAHELADRQLGDGWVELDLGAETTVHDAVVLCRVAYLSFVARTRQDRPDAFPTVNLDDALAELDLSPGVVHLVREMARM